MLGHVLPEGAFLRTVVRAVAWVAWIAVVLHVTGLLPDVIDTLDDVGFTLGLQRVSLWLAMKAVGALAIALTVALWLGRFTEGRVLAEQSIEMSTRIVITKVVRVAALFIAVLVALPLVGIDVTTLSIFSGALGVGLGFGLQKIASNYVSGFIVLLDRSLRIGDVITVDGRRGEVRAIESRYTVIRGGDGVETIVPNEMLITQSVNHHTYSDPRVSVMVSVQVGYRADVERALALLVEIASRQDEVLADPAPISRVKGLAESGVDLDLISWIANPVRDGAVRGAILLGVLRAFRAEGIEIPYPRREVQLLATDATKENPIASST
jgi:small-conductance mechanosensitive channel